MLSVLGNMSRHLGSANSNSQATKARSEQDLDSNLLTAERPMGFTLPVWQLPAPPQDVRGRSSRSSEGGGRMGFKAVLSPFQALWTASKTAAGALGSAVLPKPPVFALASSSPMLHEGSALPDNLPGFDAPRSFGPGSIPGRFAVKAASVVADVEPVVMERSSDAVPASVYPALEDLFLRSPDRSTEDAARPAKVKQGRGVAGMAPTQPQSKRIRRDPADYLAPPTSRARAMLQLEKDRVAIGPVTASAPVPEQRVTAASAPQALGTELKTFRRTLDLPDGFRRAPPAKGGVRLAPTPAQIAKSRSMANLSEENGVRVRGASARVQQGSLSMAEVQLLTLYFIPVLRSDSIEPAYWWYIRVGHHLSMSWLLCMCLNPSFGTPCRSSCAEVNGYLLHFAQLSLSCPPSQSQIGYGTAHHIKAKLDMELPGYVPS